jgi:hypothetical protein
LAGAGTRLSSARRISIDPQRDGVGASSRRISVERNRPSALPNASAPSRHRFHPARRRSRSAASLVGISDRRLDRRQAFEQRQVVRGLLNDPLPVRRNGARGAGRSGLVAARLGFRDGRVLRRNRGLLLGIAEAGRQHGLLAQRRDCRRQRRRRTE